MTMTASTLFSPSRNWSLLTVFLLLLGSSFARADRYDPGLIQAAQHLDRSARSLCDCFSRGHAGISGDLAEDLEEEFEELQEDAEEVARDLSRGKGRDEVRGEMKDLRKTMNKIDALMQRARIHPHSYRPLCETKEALQTLEEYYYGHGLGVGTRFDRRDRYSSDAYDYRGRQTGYDPYAYRAPYSDQHRHRQHRNDEDDFDGAELLRTLLRRYLY